MSSPLRKKKEIVYEGLTYDEARYSPWKVGVAGSHCVCRPAWRVGPGRGVAGRGHLRQGTVAWKLTNQA
jgi:hypothetical protein